MKSRFLLPVCAVLLTAAVSFGINAFASTFTEPSGSPTNYNAPAPLDTSANANAKVGGLILNTGGAANGLIVQSGNVGIGTASPQPTSPANSSSSGNLTANDVYLASTRQWLSTDVENVVTRFIESDCGEATNQCPAGYVQVGQWHVGYPAPNACSYSDYIDQYGSRESGWVGLCVEQ